MLATNTTRWDKEFRPTQYGRIGDSGAFFGTPLRGSNFALLSRLVPQPHSQVTHRFHLDKFVSQGSARAVRSRISAIDASVHQFDSNVQHSHGLPLPVVLMRVRTSYRGTLWPFAASPQRRDGEPKFDT